MPTTLTARRILTHPWFAMACMVMVLAVPRFSAAAAAAGSALIVSAFVAVLPDRFRSRSGSMTTALALVAALWFAAVVVAVLSFIDAIG